MATDLITDYNEANQSVFLKRVEMALIDVAFNLIGEAQGLMTAAQSAKRQAYCALVLSPGGAEKQRQVVAEAILLDMGGDPPGDNGLKTRITAAWDKFSKVTTADLV